MVSCPGGLLGCPGRPWRRLLRRPGRVPGTSLRGPGSSWRVPGGQDGVSDGSGVFEEDIWRGPGRPFFSFWGGWICTRYNEILIFFILGGFLTASMDGEPCYCFCSFFNHSFCEPVRWIYYKNQLIFNNSEISVFKIVWKKSDENMISGGEFWAFGSPILMKILVVFW